MRVKFLSRQLYESEGRNKGHVFEEGEVHDFTPDFAERWLRRLVAEPVAGGEDAQLVGREGPFVAVVDAAPAAKSGKGSKKAAATDTGANGDAAPPIAAGMRVMLISGGPVMTVTGIEPDGGIAATWPNEDGTTGADIFGADTLELAPAA